MTTVATTVREISHTVRINLEDAPTLKDDTGRRRKPVGLRLTYGIRRDISRVDIVIEYARSAAHYPPTADMPDWLRQIIDRHMPRDVDQPHDHRGTGMGGWPINPPAPLTA